MRLRTLKFVCCFLVSAFVVESACARGFFEQNVYGAGGDISRRLWPPISMVMGCLMWQSQITPTALSIYSSEKGTVLYVFSSPPYRQERVPGRLLREI